MQIKHKFSFVEWFKNFDFLTISKRYAPQEELVYTSFGIFCIISTICTMYYMSSIPDVREQKSLLYIYESMLVLSVCIVTCPIWPNALKKDIIIQIIWNIGVFYLLIVCSSFFIILSNFASLEIVVFTVNLIVVAILMRWKAAVLMITVGLYVGMQFYQYYTGVNLHNVDTGIKSSAFVLYAFLLIAAAIIIFLKPKQERQELTEAKNFHLRKQISEREQELEKYLMLKNEFIQNIQHEINTPVTGIVSLAQTLDQDYSKFSVKERRDAIKSIAASAQRFDVVINSLLDLSKLSSLTYVLDKKLINFSNLVHKRLDYCRRLYIENKVLGFSTKIQQNLVINCDEHYIASTIDHLIINAIKYSNEGNITIGLSQSDNIIDFYITDEGVGIPKHELYHIFGAFIVGSKTRTKSGYIPNGHRGIGLTLCEKAIVAHNGTIWAESDGVKGATFRFSLPI